ncbi:hypothetical protein [Blastococcus litoris]|uniref:hypothetical protein n=1 Tax=Blastococcus litoris TaxID=2171622 RepID=UPI000E300641|nr:hypothetical protein [Blastococcus litoris]
MHVPLLQIGGTVAVVAALIAWTGPVFRWSRRVVQRRRAARRPDPSRRPLQVVAADVRRLGRSVALVPAGAPMARRRALTAAYDDVLVEAAQQLEVAHELRTTPEGPARDLERLRLVAALEAAGLAVQA